MFLFPLNLRIESFSTIFLWKESKFWLSSFLQDIVIVFTIFKLLRIHIFMSLCQMTLPLSVGKQLLLFITLSIWFLREKALNTYSLLRISYPSLELLIWRNLYTVHFIYRRVSAWGGGFARWDWTKSNWRGRVYFRLSWKVTLWVIVGTFLFKFVFNMISSQAQA